MLKDVMAHIKGRTLYPLCGRDYMWIRDNAVLGDLDRWSLNRLKERIKEDRTDAECVRMDFENPPFVPGAFETMIYKPGYGMAGYLPQDMRHIQKVDPSVLICVKSERNGGIEFYEPPVTSETMDVLKEGGYELEGSYPKEEGEALDGCHFTSTFAMALRKKDSGLTISSASRT